MSEFADEARSRAAHLLRMAGTQDERVREQILRYVDATPDPPVMGRAGIATAGCPRCRRTMWRQRDGWVCSSCGHVEEKLPVRCPSCQVAMKAPPEHRFGRWCCPRCDRVAVASESATEVEGRERGRVDALRLLDEAIAERRTAACGDPGHAVYAWSFADAVAERESLRVQAGARMLGT